MRSANQCGMPAGVDICVKTKTTGWNIVHDQKSNYANSQNWTLATNDQGLNMHQIFAQYGNVLLTIAHAEEQGR
jgi:hypothetical protein